MGPDTSRPIDTVRLSEREKKRLVAALNAPAPLPAGAERRGLRVSFNIGSVLVEIAHPLGRPVRYVVAPRNLSPRGLAFVHGRFVYPESRALVVLPTLHRRHVPAPGRVLRCRHLSGLIHEVSLVFDQGIELSEFVQTRGGSEFRVAGSEFRVHGPDLNTEPGTRHPQLGTRNAELPIRAVRAVILDSCENNRRLLHVWLSKLRMRVREVEDLCQALAAVEQGVDLLLVELGFDIERGLAQVQRLRGAGFAGVVVALCSEGGDQTQAAALAAGCNAAMTRPYDPGQLAHVLDQLLSVQMRWEAPQPVRSTLAGDPELRPLIEQFVVELPLGIKALSRAVTDEDWVVLRRLCLQFKGSGANYGFEPVTRVAQAVLESLAAQRGPDCLRQGVEELTGLLRRLAV